MEALNSLVYVCVAFFPVSPCLALVGCSPGVAGVMYGLSRSWFVSRGCRLFVLVLRSFPLFSYSDYYQC